MTVPPLRPKGANNLQQVLALAAHHLWGIGAGACWLSRPSETMHGQAREGLMAVAVGKTNATSW